MVQQKILALPGVKHRSNSPYTCLTHSPIRELVKLRSSHSIAPIQCRSRFQIQRWERIFCGRVALDLVRCLCPMDACDYGWHEQKRRDFIIEAERALLSAYSGPCPKKANHESHLLQIRALPPTKARATFGVDWAAFILLATGKIRPGKNFS